MEAVSSTRAVGAAASERTLTWLLGGLAMLGPLSVDAYLPAFDSIARTLHVGAASVQLTLTAYLAAFAFMSLWHGALSDALGRRRVVLASLIVFALASAACAFASDIGALSACRILQGASAGAGTVVGRAIVRDLYDGSRAARMLSWVSMIFALSPAIAPILGGWIVTHYQWRAVFVFLTIYTVILLLACWRGLPETLQPKQRQPLGFASMLANYIKVARAPAFVFASGAIAFNFAGLFLYVAAAPVILGEHLGLSANQFGWQFVPMVAGIFLGSWAAERLSGSWRERTIVAASFGLMLAAGVANTAYHLWLAPALPWSVSPIFFYAFGMSLAAPVLTLQVLNLFDQLRGLVASMQAFTMVALAALTTAVLAPMLQGSMFQLALGQLLLAVVGLLFWLPSLRQPQH